MILVYVDNDRLGEVADIVETLKEEYGTISYRNPRLFDKPNPCKGVYIHGEWPEVEAAYDNIIHMEDAQSDYPKSKGAGWYELSNGSSVRGKDNAIEAENNL